MQLYRTSKKLKMNSVPKTLSGKLLGLGLNEMEVH